MKQNMKIFDSMKRLPLILVLLFAVFTPFVAYAQYNYPHPGNNDILLPAMRNTINGRTEVFIPQVNGYNVYKADLHIHTVCSDGQITPAHRVREAWRDGLDIIAIADHMEYRRFEKRFIEYLQDYFPEAIKVKNTTKDASEIKVDLNCSVKWAQKSAKDYPVLIIPAAEITRSEGHYNALFSTDNNVIPNADPIQAIRNAKAQGCLVQHNHPGKRRPSIEMTDFEKAVYAEGLIDGIEVMNGEEFYPKVIDRADEYGLYMSSNTDIHSNSEGDYEGTKLGRNMTLILSKENSLEAIREALMAKRTICYSYDRFAGEESLLKDLFNACVSFSVVSRNEKKGTTKFTITNSSSLPFVVCLPGSDPQWIDPFKAVMVTGKDLRLEIVNMWCGGNSHPIVDVKF